MKPFLRVLAIVATVGVFIADLLLLGHPAFRNGWWTLSLFAVPATLLLLAMGGRDDAAKRLRVAGWAVFFVGLGGYVALRTTTGRIEGAPGVAVGDLAPDFMLKDAEGKDVRLSDVSDGRRVLIVFFRGKNCPVCRAELRGLAERYPDFRDSRVEVVAVGPQTPEQSKSLGLPFPVLSDPDLEATKKYGLVHPRGGPVIDVPRPAKLLLDKDRRIRWISAEDHIRTRPPVDEIFEALRTR